MTLSLSKKVPFSSTNANKGAEEQLLGTLLNADGNILASYNMPIDYLGIHKHRAIYEGLIETSANNQIGFPFLIAKLREKGNWSDEFEDPTLVTMEYLCQLQEKAGPPSQIPGLIRLIEISYQQRILGNLFNEFDASDALNRQMSEADLKAAQDRIIEIAYQSRLSKVTNGQSLHIGEAIDEAIERETHSSIVPTKISTKLDAALGGGFRAGESILLAGRPSEGKSALALSMIAQLAPSHLIIMFSLEMDRQSIAQRLLATVAKVNLQAIRSRSFYSNFETTQRVMEAGEFISKWRLYVEDAPRISVNDMVHKCRMISQQEDSIPSLVVVDYLQLVKPRHAKDPREQQISQISRGLKEMAKLLKCPILAISQLNRAVKTELTKDQKPALHHLRESGSLEQDADTVIAIYHRHKDSPDVDICILKQRNGPVGDVKLYWQPEITTFKE